MAKPSEIDLLPWIWGGVLIAAGGIATVIGTSAHTNSPTPVSAPPVAAVIATTPAVAPPPMAAQSIARPPPLLPGQVWQCVVNGQPTFSDSPCGASSSVRQLTEVNRMHATPLAPASVRQTAELEDAPDSAVPFTQNTAYSTNVFASEQIYVIKERTRREHEHEHSPRRHQHDHEPPRKN